MTWDRNGRVDRKRASNSQREPAPLPPPITPPLKMFMVNATFCGADLWLKVPARNVLDALTATRMMFIDPENVDINAIYKENGQ